MKPSRLALFLLRCVPGGDPIIGDLIEGFATRQSRWWLWRQVLAAVVTAVRQRREPSLTWGHVLPSPGVMSDARTRVRDPWRTPLSMTGNPNVGGLGLLTIVLLISVVSPQVWWVLAASAAGGAVLGVIRIALHRPQHSSQVLPL
jgi:hypothetical protein